MQEQWRTFSEKKEKSVKRRDQCWAKPGGENTSKVQSFALMRQSLRRRKVTLFFHLTRFSSDKRKKQFETSFLGFVSRFLTNCVTNYGKTEQELLIMKTFKRRYTLLYVVQLYEQVFLIFSQYTQTHYTNITQKKINKQKETIKYSKEMFR